MQGAGAEDMIYHLAVKSDWESAQKRGQYKPASLSTEGFIHCSMREQVEGVANSFFKGRNDLVLLYINPDRLQAVLRYEPPAHPSVPAEDAPLRREMTALFPHLYGALNLDAVVMFRFLMPEPDGRFELSAFL